MVVSSWLAIVNNEDWHFKFQNRSRDASIIRGWNERFAFSLNNGLNYIKWVLNLQNLVLMFACVCVFVCACFARGRGREAKWEKMWSKFCLSHFHMWSYVGMCFYLLKCTYTFGSILNQNLISHVDTLGSIKKVGKNWCLFTLMRST